MCCRYYMEMSPKLRPIVESAQRSGLYQRNIQKIARPLTAEGEVFPDALVPVAATSRTGEKTVFPMLWGYHVPGIRRTIANARIESAAEKICFRDSWIAHRCAVPASWYYEWEHLLTPSGRPKAGEKYAIMPRNGEITWLCGLYHMENDYPHFVILTREAGENISFIHDRMPFILPEEKIAAWTDPDRNPHMLPDSALTDMVFEKQERRPQQIRA